MNDVKVFYQNEDLWQIASEIYGTEEQPMTPNYYIMKLPGEKSAEFVNSIPFTPKDKKNLAKTYFEMEASLLGKKHYASFQKSIERYISDDISNGIRNGSISEDILQASTQKEAERAIAKMQDC